MLYRKIVRKWRRIHELWTHRVCYVADSASWVVDREARSITKWVETLYGRPCYITDRPADGFRDIVHFGCQHLFTGGGFRDVRRSNRIVLSFYHGDKKDPLFARPVETILREQYRLDRIIVSCGIMRERMLEWGIPDKKLCLIPVGVDREVFHPADSLLRDASRARFGIKFHHVVIGSFQKDGEGWGEGLNPKLVKGPDVLLRVIERLKEQFPLYILLTGPARGYVKKGLERLGVPYQHLVVDSFADMAACYQALDLYLVTSREEGGPKAVMESMASGVPLVSTRVGMAADYVRDGENGFLCEVGDEEGLAQRASEVLASREIRERCIANGLVTARQCDYREVARMHYEQVYAPLLKTWWA